MSVDPSPVAPPAGRAPSAAPANGVVDGTISAADAGAVLERMADAYVAFDAQLRYVAVNAAGERSMQRPRAALLGRALTDAFPSAAGSESERQYRQVAATGVEAHFTEHYVGDRLDNWVEVDAYPTGDTPPHGVAVFWREVTGRVRAERALQEASAALAARNAELQDQRLELEVANADLQAQAAELEATTEALQAQAAELEEANEALRDTAGRLVESEARLRRVADSGIVGLFFWDLAGGITDANDAFLTLLGYTRDDLAAGRVDWRAMTPPEFTAVDAAAVDELLATGRHGQIVKEYVACDGQRVPVVIQSAFLGGSRTRGVCVCLDDTARRHAEARLGRVLAQTPAAIAVLLGPDHVVQSANETFLRLLGRRDYVGRPAGEAAPELAEQGFLPLLDDVYRTGQPFAAREAPLVWDRDGDGTMHEGFFDFVYQPLAHAAGSTEGVLVFAVEVTAQVRARRVVEGLNTELQAEARAAEEARAAAERERARAIEANAVKAQFLANMSHELRTPLNAIAGYAQLLDLGLHGPVTEAQRQALGRVQGAQRHLLALINDVLNYARLESGRVEYAVRAVDVRDVVHEVTPLVEPQLRAKGLAFAVRLPDEPVAVWADRDKLGQVLVNLLSNAVKFTDPAHPRTGAPGRVTVDLVTRPSASGASGDAVLVRVTDTGRGIPREKQDAVFEPFVQVRTGYAQATEGTGLGLAISRDLARGMGGELTAESVPGVGSTFTVTLRRVMPGAGDAAAPDGGGVSSASEPRDDEPHRAAF